MKKGGVKKGESKKGRRNILDVTEDILNLLSKKSNLSVKAISEEIGSQWETTIKSLEFLKRINLVKEKPGEKSYKTERLWSLK
jgi:Mn-dependent DtxR family transcriptional regulator